MTQTLATIPLATPENTAAFAAKLANILRVGDVILLQGGIGAGKSHFARSYIQSLQTTPEDVPSPTFTLVQVYDTTAGDIWHADLYRLTGPDDIIELGLTDAFETAICLIEWPDRLADLTPPNALLLDFIVCDDDSRILTLSGSKEYWSTRLGSVVNV